MKKIVVIGVIALFVGVGFQPAFANIMENHPPYAPSNYYPCGEIEIPLVVNLSWDGGDPDPGDSVYYDVYLNDVKIATVGPYPWNQTRIEYGPIELESYTTYYMKIDAYDNHGAYAFGHICKFTYGDIHPPSKPIIDGPTHGKFGVEYTYTFNSTDYNGDYCACSVDWGDGTPIEFVPPTWPNPDETGPGIANHSWDTKGTYVIKARAEDEFGYCSPWGELQVTIPRDKTVSNYILLLRILERFPLLQKLIHQLGFGL